MTMSDSFKVGWVLGMLYGFISGALMAQERYGDLVIFSIIAVVAAALVRFGVAYWRHEI